MKSLADPPPLRARIGRAAKHKEAGFSAFEALVAVTIMGIVLIPLTEMQTQLAQQYRERRAASEALAAQRNALAILREANVMAEPTGTRDLGEERRLKWTSEPITKPKRSIRFLGGEGDFEVALYLVQAEVSLPRSPAAKFEVEQLGWRRLAE